MKTTYHTIRKQGKINEKQLASFLVKNGQGLLPMVDLIEQCQLACDELIDVTGRAAIQAVLQLSAMEAVGGPPQQGKRRSSDVVFYGRQPGQVMLSDRKLEVERPRLRTRGRASREVEVPAYQAMHNGEQMGARMLEILMRGVSMRNYKEVIPTMAETVGVSKSAVSRRVVEASEAEVETLLSRRFDELKLLVIYIDGLLFGDYTMIGAVGVDSEGNKHVLGIREGATENSTVVKELLEDTVARGVDPKRQLHLGAGLEPTADRVMVNDSIAHPVVGFGVVAELALPKLDPYARRGIGGRDSVIGAEHFGPFGRQRRISGKNLLKLTLAIRGDNLDPNRVREGRRRRHQAVPYFELSHVGLKRRG